MATDQKPEITVPRGDPPPDLVIEDLSDGNGPVAAAGTLATVDYVGVSWSTGTQFDASWDRNDPFAFSVGAGEVIEGWDRGVEGMRVGGRRRLTIPPHLGYGSHGAGNVIAPDETLIFVVDLRKVG